LIENARPPFTGLGVSKNSLPENESKTAAEQLRIAAEVLRWEATCIERLTGKLDPVFPQLVAAILGCRGKLILTGMGKMGAIAHKAAATFCSTGTPAVYLHPAEGLHGDLGVAASGDVMVALSTSGETEEIAGLIPYLTRKEIPLAVITGRPDSKLAKQANWVFDLGIEREADTVTSAPTASTTAALAFCDALAVVVARCRNLTAEQFALYHPGGFLGRRLLLTVSELMHQGERVPLIGPNSPLREAIVEISRKSLGAVFVVDAQGQIVGILTDGDLRRSLGVGGNPLEEPVSRHMSSRPRTIAPGEKAVAAIHLMEQHAITVLPVVDEKGKPIGAIHLHDLVKAGLGSRVSPA
jgi:arabinose-5-phosphate isomerase